MQGQWLQVLGPYLLIHRILIFQPVDRGYMSESGLSDRYSPRAAIAKGLCRSSHDDYATGLDDYDTLFKARHGREMIDIVPKVSAPMIGTQVVPTTFGGTIPCAC